MCYVEPYQRTLACELSDPDSSLSSPDILPVTRRPILLEVLSMLSRVRKRLLC